MIAFNCPNGHRIVVPARAAGQRGKCTQCGTPVIIPTGGKAEGAAGRPDSRDDLFAGLGDDAVGEPLDTDLMGMSPEIGQHQPGGVEAEQAGEALHAHPTATLVARLFQEVEHGGVVEIHIAGGSVILPEFYEFRWSAGSHGLFASRAADGKVTLTAVAWDSIQKIIVRHLDFLPDGMFE